MPSNLGWEISPGDRVIIEREIAARGATDLPRMTESCATCGHPRLSHDMESGEHCDACGFPDAFGVSCPTDFRTPENTLR